MTEKQSADAAHSESPSGSDKLRERVAALNEKAGNLSETLERIDERLSEVLGNRQRE
jgi:hypothetical protein